MERTSKLFFWFFAGASLLTTLVVVVPYYFHRIPAEAAGNEQRYDVKHYWPFRADDFIGGLHYLAIVLALAAPLFFGISLIWSCLVLWMERGRERRAALVVSLCNLVGALAYLAQWRSVIAWHLD